MFQKHVYAASGMLRVEITIVEIYGNKVKREQGHSNTSGQGVRLSTDVNLCFYELPEFYSL